MTASYHLIVPMPAGRISSSKGRLSVYFVPRLQATGPLTDWNNDWRNWPRVVDGTAPGAGGTLLRLSTQIDGNSNPANQGLRHIDAAWTSPTPSVDAWTAVFGTGAPGTSIGVNRFSPIYRDTMKLAAMFNARELAEKIPALHQALAVESPNGPPTSEDLTALSAYSSLAGSDELDRHTLHNEPLGDGDVDDEPTPEEADFHEALTFLQSHPELLRTLGLVVDLEVTIPPVTYGDMAVAVGSNYTRPDADALPLIVQTGSDFWPVDGPGKWSDIRASHTVAQVDLAAGVSTTASITENSTAAAPDDPIDVAPLTSAGLYLARSGDDLAMEVEEVWTQQAEFEDSIYDFFDGTQSLPIPLDGDLLTVGRRYDVWDDTVGEWFSVWEREVPNGFVFPRDNTLSIDPPMDEGWMTYTASTEMRSDVRGPDDPPGEGPAGKKEDHTSIRINPIVFSWRGWSLAAAPPGRAFSGKNGAVDPVANTPTTDMLVKAVVEYEVPDGKLPRLRYLRRYKFRSRTVDFAGNSRALAETHPGNETETPLFTYGRMNRLASPVTVRRVDRPVPGWGDTTTTLVIKSELNQNLGTVEPTSRLVFPGRTSQFQCELHGFPAPDGLFTDQATFDEVVARTAKSIDDHTRPQLATGELVVEPAGAWRDGIDYLTEPGQSGFAFSGLPGMSNPAIVPVPTAWPLSHTTSVQIEAGSGAPTVNPTNSNGPAVVAQVPPGVTTSTTVSGTIDPTLAEHWSTFQGFDAPERALLADSIGAGQHWMFSQSQVLSLVHAVRQPLLIPAVIGTPNVNRDPNKTKITIVGTLSIDVKSTDRVKATGEWTDPIDTPGAPGGIRQQSTTRVLFNQREEYSEEVTEPITSGKVEVGDTKRHEALLSLEAFSRYARYFTERSFVQFIGDDSSVELAPEGVTTLNLDVQSSAGTARPDVDYVVNGEKGIITRLPGGAIPIGEDVLVDFIRRPVNRLFDEAGAEKVPFRIPNGAKPASIGVVEVLPAFARTRFDENGTLGVEHEGQTVRVWLERPWFTTGVGELLGVLVGSSDEQELSQLARDPLSPAGPPNALALDDFPAATETRTGVAGSFGHVAGHEVVFDEDRQLWFADIVIGADLGYRPFVKLALVRFQPESITGAHIGESVVTAPVRLGASRTSEITRSGTTATIEVIGQELGNEVTAWFQETDPAIADADLSWDDLTEPVVLAASVGPDGTTWSDTLTLPTATNQVRLVVEDAEMLTSQQAGGDVEVRNISYLDTIVLPYDWTGGTPPTTSTTTTTTTTVPGAGAPAAIADLTGQGGDEAALLTWTAPDDGGSPITGYEVQRSGPRGTWDTIAELTPNRTKHVARGLVNGLLVSFRVRAKNAEGNGAWSAEVAVTPDVQAPGRVRKLRAFTGGGLVRLRWRAAADRGSPLLGYRLERRVAGGSWGNTVQIDPDTTEHTVDDVASGTEVGFRVRGVNAVGQGKWSQAETVTVDGSGTPPDQVHGVTLAPGAGSLTVTWLPVGDGGAALTRYDIEVSDTGTGATQTVKIEPDELVREFAGLSPATTYEVRVRAVNLIGDGDWSTITAGSPI